jgi:hypothetical protein
MRREKPVRLIEWTAEKKLKELNLVRRGLKKLPLEIVKCTHLIDLDLTCNSITSIPDMLDQLPNLTRLSLRNNRITFIPDTLGQLLNLTWLQLGYNQITFIPDALGQLSNLRVLDLSNNRITSIPDALGQLSNLRVLDLGNNQITSIPDALGQLSNLRELRLPHNQITEIPEAIRSLKNLEKLDLRGNPLPIPPQVLGELRLPHNQITEIPEAIRSLKNLEKLDLRGNPLPIPSQVLEQGQDDEGCGNLRTILDFYSHTRNSVLPELDAEREKIESEGYFDAETLQDARQRITASIVQRQGQAGFRRKLLIAYGGRCPITDCDVESAIEAAHIIPYQGTQTNHVTNGLPLRADIHTLFDLHLLSIRPDTNQVVIAPELIGTCYQGLADRKLTLPQERKTAPNQNALSKHYETFLSKCKSSQLQRL